MNEGLNDKRDPYNTTPKSLWIPFSVAGLFIALIGWFRFDDPGLEKYLVYTILIGLAVAVFPWIKSFKIKGLFELERSIVKIQDETNQQFRELRTYLNVIQSQVTTQKVDQAQNIAVNINERKISDEELMQKEEEEKEFEKKAMVNIESIDEKKSSFFSKVGSLIKKTWIKEACKKRSIDINKVNYAQAFSVSGNQLQNPLLSLMEITFDAILSTQGNDIFFELLLLNKKKDAIHNYLFRALSFLEKYREAKSKQYKLILIIPYGEKFNIQKEAAAEIKEYTNTHFSAFISEGRLEIDLYDAEKIIFKQSSVNKSKKNKETK